MHTRTEKKDSPLHLFKNVQYATSIHAGALFFSTLLLFAIIELLGIILKISVIPTIVGLILATIYFMVLNKKYVLRVADFKLSSDKLEWNGESIDFANIKYYRIHWHNGASLNIRLKSGKTIKMMASSLFCKTPMEFVNLCITLDSALKEYDKNQKMKKKTLSEARFYLPLFYSLSILASSLAIYRLLRRDFILHEIVILFVLTAFLFRFLWKGKE